MLPFIKFLPGTILTACKEFEDRFSIIEEKLPAAQMVRKAARQKFNECIFFCTGEGCVFSNAPPDSIKTIK